ncbi:MAG TPA: translation initiation factor IF-2 N-terminal domain-containing protein, partial [Gemmatimonadota bacterium]|nr:translation initiation factor IF-2 N-terminal domain-containing protein [Gemmatimonadota bacterium]
MAKVRIYEVARRFNVSSEAMVNLLKEMGVPVKNHMSSIDEDTVARVAGKFESEKEAVKHAEEEKKRRQDEAKRRRRTQRPAARVEAAPAAGVAESKADAVVAAPDGDAEGRVAA